MNRIDAESEIFVVETSPTLRSGGNQTGGDRPPGTDVDTCDSLVVTDSLRADGFDASEDGTGRSTPLVPVIAPCLTGNYGKQPDSSDTSSGPMVIPVAIPILEAGARTGMSTTDPRSDIGIGESSDPMFTLQSGKQHAVGFYANDSGNDAGEELAPTLRSMDGGGGNHPAVAFTERGREKGRTFECQEEQAYCLTNPGSGGRTHSRSLMDTRMAVRRLTPTECERLQGFPDGYTQIPRGRKGSPTADGPRYKALGNSMAVPCIAWIFERMDAVDRLTRGGHKP